MCVYLSRAFLRRAEQAYVCHVERYARSASIQRLHVPSTQGDNLVPPKSPKYNRNERTVEKEIDTEGNVNINDPEVPKENPIEDKQVKTMKEDGKTVYLEGAIKARMNFQDKKAKSNVEDDKIVPMDKINEGLDEQEQSQKA